MKFKVLSRAEFENFISKEKYIAISISDPDSEPVESQKDYTAILSLQFHDVDHRIKKQKDCKLCNGTGKSPLFPDINGGHCYACTDKMDIKIFDETYAEQILDFINAYKDIVDLIVVHCEAGISRSSATAAALSLILNGEDQFFYDHYLPNALVYRKIINVAVKRGYFK